MKRKGVSPLIAAVLLIAFTMAVAAILTAWVTTFTQEQTDQLGNESEQQIDCSFAQISIYSTSANDDDSLDVAVENSGQEDLENVSVSAITGGSVGDKAYKGPLSAGQIVTATLTDEADAGEVRVASQNCPGVTVTETL